MSHTEPVEFRDGVWSLRGIEFVALDLIDESLAFVTFRLRAELLSGERWLDIKNGFELGPSDARGLIDCFEKMYSGPRRRGDTTEWTSLWEDFQLQIRSVDDRGHFEVRAAFTYPPSSPARAVDVSLCEPIETKGLNKAAIGLRQFFGPWAGV